MPLGKALKRPMPVQEAAEHAACRLKRAETTTDRGKVDVELRRHRTCRCGDQM